MENLDQVGLRVMRKGKYSEWSAGGPDKWHSDWQELMAKTKKKPIREINGVFHHVLNASDFGSAYTEENKQIFPERKKDPAFANDIEEVRAGNHTRSQHYKDKGRA